MRMLLLLILLLITAAPIAAQTGGSVVINEFSYDDSSTDNYEYVELYNTTSKNIDISKWVLHSNDSNGPNNIFTFPANTIIKAGEFFVIGSPLVPNVDLVTSMATNIWQNSNEDLALLDTNSKIIDSVAYEASKGLWPSSSAGPASREEGEGLWGNFCGIQRANNHVAILLGRNVAPTAVTSKGCGRATIIFDPATLKVDVKVMVTGLVPIAVSLNEGKAGVNGKHFIKLSGTGLVWTGSTTVTATQMTALQAGDTYINVMTTANPNGELRGQALFLPGNSCSRYRDGVDTGNNGFDFGDLPSTPGMTNKSLRANQTTFLDPFDMTAVGQAAEWWSGSFLAPMVIDPTQICANNPSVITASPQGGKAIVLWDPAGGGNAAALAINGMGGDVVLEGYFYFDATLPTGATENQTWSVGIGGATGSYYNTPDPGGSLGFTANGNTGLAWTYQVTSTGAVLYLVDHNDGGWGVGCKTAPLVLGQIPITKGKNDGWQRLRLERSGTQLLGTFGGTLSGAGGTWIAGTANYTTTTWGIYAGYREAYATNSAARPLTIDMLLVRAANTDLGYFGQAKATTTGTPLINTMGPATVGSQAWGINLSGLIPSSSTFIVMGLNLMPSPLPLSFMGGQTGSNLYVNPFMPFAVVNTTAGTAKLPLPIPADSNLIGGKVHWQALTLDPALTVSLKLANTNGMTTQFGN